MYVGTHKSGFSHVVAVFDLLPKEMNHGFFFYLLALQGKQASALILSA